MARPRYRRRWALLPEPPCFRRVHAVPTPGDDEMVSLRWCDATEIGRLDLDPLNRHLLRDAGVITV